ncbi:hypothetical protein SAMN05443144_12716 [Fodinibius roseus]|uniref:Uncharacterized protein n=1 Tax=Fodinibius roseus TaxID=1194090 RepID=A0A1M5JHJ7_9BACT|nr:hypothetical protein [Fodinibius roseus]SHG40076.1 hypothetical protein SAMN05443144_12716 [Fodinibius roseus]
MTIFLTFLFTALLLLTTNEWIASLITPNNLAEIGVVILGMIALSASLQIRTLFEKAQDILRLYARYTNPTSEEGKKLSQQEKERLLDLFLHELRMVIEQFGGKIVIRIGGFIRKVFDKLFGYKA